MHCRSWRERLLLPHIAPAQQDVDVSRRGTGSTKHLGRRLTGPPAASHTGPDEGLPRRFVRRQGDTERQGMSVELPATLISRTGIAQRGSQVSRTMIMSSRGWQALHGLTVDSRAARRAEHRYPHGPAVRGTRQLRLQARRPRRTGRSPACPGFAPLLLPERTVSVLLRTGRDP